ncbi:MAG: hypothetical protein IJQ02_03950 [Oscillospiraceae bacterium]|nr:hypothetical protein [Oscillospiraceae bacterium]
MKGTEKIIAHIEAEAKEAAEAIIKSAEEKCGRITAQYEEKAAGIYSEKIREGVQACQDREDGALRIARMEARKKVLAVKQEMVEKSFEDAKQSLLSLPEEDYLALLSRLVRDAAGTEGEEIILNRHDHEALGEKLLKIVNENGARFTLADDCGDFSGGLILRRGNIETNCSIELLVDLCRGELSSKLAEVLFR